MKSSGFGILGVGKALPPQVRKNSDWSESFHAQFSLRRGGDVTTPDVILAKAQTPAQRIQLEEMLETFHDPFRGSKERRVAPLDVEPSSLEIAAAKDALAMAEVDPKDVGLVITSSLPGDKMSPKNNCMVQHGIGATGAMSFDVDAGCAGSLTGLSVADAMLRAGRAKYAVVAASGLLTRLCDWDDPGSVGFGDGAGAVVLGPVKEKTGFLAHAATSKGELFGGICVGPKCDIAWTSAESRLLLHSKDLKVGQAVVMNAAGYAADAVEAVVQMAGIERKDITNFYAHQPAEWFNRASRRAAGLEHARTVDTFRQYANCSAANVFINMCHGVEQGQLAPGDTVLLWAFGAGFCWYSTLLTWSGTGKAAQRLL